MITLRRYTDLGQAELDKSVLEAAGIPAFLAGENSASVGYGGVLGELRLQVQEADADRARRVLDEHEGFTPLPDDFIPPENQPEANPRLENMETNIKNVVVSVAVTLLVVIAALPALNPRKTSSSDASDRPSLEYEQRVKRAEALMAGQEQSHQRYLEYLTKVEENQRRVEENQRRFEKILATWEQQQQEYQKYLDSLEKKQ
jgi:Putative prokaryotic signal transducing protein